MTLSVSKETVIKRLSYWMYTGSNSEFNWKTLINCCESIILINRSEIKTKVLSKPTADTLWQYQSTK